MLPDESQIDSTAPDYVDPACIGLNGDLIPQVQDAINLLASQPRAPLPGARVNSVPNIRSFIAYGIELEYTVYPLNRIQIHLIDKLPKMNA